MLDVIQYVGRSISMCSVSEICESHSKGFIATKFYCSITHEGQSDFEGSKWTDLFLSNSDETKCFTINANNANEF